MTRTALVTIAHGRRPHLERQQAALALCSDQPELCVLVAMDDPGLAASPPDQVPDTFVVEVPRPPLGLPLAAARNAGARAALEAGAEVLIFLDVDCMPGVELVRAYRQAALAEPDCVWSGPVTYLPPAPAGGYPITELAAWDDPHPARPAPAPGERVGQDDPDLFWSLSFALHRDAWRKSGGFWEEYVGYGGEDTDFARCVLDAGLRLGWVGSARAYHQHHPVQDPPVDHLDDILRNARIFHQRWGLWPMRGWLQQFEALGLVERRDEEPTFRPGRLR